MHDEIYRWTAMTKQIKSNFNTSNGLSAVWVIFAQTLAAVLAKLKDDDYLCLTVQDSDRYVRFSFEYDFGMRVETSSNLFLDEDEQLTAQQIVSLIASGWTPPNWTPDDPILDENEECPNYFLDFDFPISFDAAASLAVFTFAEILGIANPQQLEYFAFDGEEEAIELPELGLKAEELEEDGDPEAVSELLLETLKLTVGHNDLEFDEDGDIGIRFDTALIFAGVNLEGAFVTFFSLLLTNVLETPALFKRLNDINAKEIMLRVFYKDDVIYAVADIPAMPFVGTHVAEAFGYFCDAANKLGTQLKTEFGGDTAFGNADESPMLH